MQATSSDCIVAIKKQLARSSAARHRAAGTGHQHPRCVGAPGHLSPYDLRKIARGTADKVSAMRIAAGSGARDTKTVKLTRETAGKWRFMRIEKTTRLLKTLLVCAKKQRDYSRYSWQGCCSMRIERPSRLLEKQLAKGCFMRTKRLAS